MKISIKTFASLKEIFGFSEKIFELPEKFPVSQTLLMLKNDYPDFNSYQGHLLIAINEEFRDESVILQDGDVLALFPPVSGG